MNLLRPTLHLLSVGALVASVHAQQIPDRATLNALLGASGSFEDFEALQFSGQGILLIFGDLDSTSVVAGQGPGLVQPGVAFPEIAPGDISGRWWNQGNGFTSKVLAVSEPSGGGLSHFLLAPGARAVGFDIPITDISPAGSGVATFRDQNGGVLGTVAYSLPVGPSTTFVGFQSTQSIASVDFPTSPGFSEAFIDDLAWGNVGPTPILTDECSQAPVFPGSSSIDFDTTYMEDTGAPATTSAWQSGSCPTANNDGWVIYEPTQNGLVRVSTCGTAAFDTVIAVYQEAGVCSGTLVGCNDDLTGCSGNSSEVEFMAQIGQTYAVQVGSWSASVRGLGTLNITEVSSDPCAGLPPDFFEDNDTCATASPIGNGLFTTLNALSTDQDYYSVTVPSGGTLDVDLYFTNANGDLDLYLWDPVIACDTGVVGTGAGTGFLARGFSASDDETISYTNTTSATQNLILEVDVFDPGACNTYDLEVEGVGTGPLGTNYCMANANSTGGVAAMSAAGSPQVADNDVTIAASGLPTNSVGFFIVSDTQGFLPNPAGSQGNLCILGDIGRYQGDIQSSGAAGAFSLNIDLTTIPTPNGPRVVMPGDTLNFQSWYRDSVSGQAVSNFSDAYSIDFL